MCIRDRVISAEPIFNVEALETDTPPVPFTPSTKPQILAGMKVLELCRIIAGPTISKILAEYGATVIKVTSDSTLPDVPFFQVDGNMGKHTTNLNLKHPEDRAKFEELLKDADIIVDGYRTGVIEKLGYGPSRITELAKQRNKGYIYASENCFGFSGEWSGRPGWQQIADCVSGVAWLQGQALGKDEPMIPPFPMSDYGTGCIVAISILLAVYKRNIIGGSYWCNSSLANNDSTSAAANTSETDGQFEMSLFTTNFNDELKFKNNINIQSQIRIVFMIYRLTNFLLMMYNVPLTLSINDLNTLLIPNQHDELLWGFKSYQEFQEFNQKDQKPLDFYLNGGEKIVYKNLLLSMTMSESDNSKKLSSLSNFGFICVVHGLFEIKQYQEMKDVDILKCLDDLTRFLPSITTVSYTHLDVYKRQV